jgi:hypothetical protein
LTARETVISERPACVEKEHGSVLDTRGGLIVLKMIGLGLALEN